MLKQKNSVLKMQKALLKYNRVKKFSVKNAKKWCYKCREPVLKYFNDKHVYKMRL